MAQKRRPLTQARFKPSAPSRAFHIKPLTPASPPPPIWTSAATANPVVALHDANDAYGLCTSVLESSLKGNGGSMTGELRDGAISYLVLEHCLRYSPGYARRGHPRYQRTRPNTMLERPPSPYSSQNPP